jgi:hypothetical protein
MCWCGTRRGPVRPAQVWRSTRCAGGLALATTVLVGMPPPALAQTLAAPVRWTIGLERRAEHDRYHFENPTTFDSPEPVPHFFEQRYDAGNTWLFVRAGYRLLGGRAATEAGVAPSIHTAGSDIDTFLLPSGDVATSGTSGLVSMYSFSVSERLTLAAWHGVDLGVVVEYRRSRANFLPDYRVVTHSQPASETREFTTDRETTVSHVLGSGFTADVELAAGAGWRLSVGGDVLPAVRGWLVTKLPDKYPGQDIVAEALNFGAAARLSLERRWARVAAGVRGDARGVWHYHRSAQYRERGAGVAIFVTLGRN